MKFILVVTIIVVLTIGSYLLILTGVLQERKRQVCPTAGEILRIEKMSGQLIQVYELYVNDLKSKIEEAEVQEKRWMNSYYNLKKEIINQQKEDNKLDN